MANYTEDEIKKVISSLRQSFEAFEKTLKDCSHTDITGNHLIIRILHIINSLKWQINNSEEAVKCLKLYVETKFSMIKIN